MIRIKFCVDKLVKILSNLSQYCQCINWLGDIFFSATCRVSCFPKSIPAFPHLPHCDYNLPSDVSAANHPTFCYSRTQSHIWIHEPPYEKRVQLKGFYNRSSINLNTTPFTDSPNPAVTNSLCCVSAAYRYWVQISAYRGSSSWQRLVLGL